MRITDQFLVVLDYGSEEEDVVACADGREEAQGCAEDYKDLGPVTICRVKIIEVVGTVEATEGT